MTRLYLISVVALLTSADIVLVSGSPVKPSIRPLTRTLMQQLHTKILDKIAEIDGNQELAEMAAKDQKAAQNGYGYRPYNKDQQLLVGMILEMLMNQQVQKESVIGVQEDKQVGEEEEPQATIIQNISDKMFQVEKEEEEIAEQEIHLVHVNCNLNIGGHCSHH